MKKISLLILLLFTQISLGQGSRKEMAQSNIYIRATYFKKKNDIIGLQVRTNLYDTLINNRQFQKFKTEDFIDYSEIEDTKIYYESFLNDNYQLLDKQLNYIHNINYKTIQEQKAILFGEDVNISLEFIDGRTSFPRDSLIPSDKTPRKYYKSDNDEIYAVIIPDLKTLAVSSNGQFYTKQLFGDNYNDISEGIRNKFKANTHFEIQPGDEVQLFFRRKWINDSTGITEYNDKQFKNIKYLGDTIIEGVKSLKMQVEGYNYLSGSIEEPEEFYTQITDSGYYSSSQFIPFKDFKTELKIIHQDGQKGYFLQGVCLDTINGFTYEKIVQAKPGYYRYFTLPFFPLQFIEFGNVQAIITYSKIKGIEKGEKRERTYIVDENNIRSIRSISNNEVEVIFYALEKLTFDIVIKDYESDETIGSIKSKSKKGINSFIIKTDKLEKGKYYNVNINYSEKNTSGSFSNGFKSKH